MNGQSAICKTIPCYTMSYKIREASSKVWLWLARNHRTAAASTLACRRGWSLSRLRRGPRTANWYVVCFGAFDMCLGHTANGRNTVVIRGWGVVNRRMQKVWKTKLPMKLKVFMWLVYHDKLQTGGELRKRKWKGDPNCTICGTLETTRTTFSSRAA